MGSPARRARRPAAVLLVAALAAISGAGSAQEESGGQPAAAAPAELPNTWYAQALAYSSVGINVTHFWSKESKLRAETVIAGRRVVTIVVGDTYYAYDLLGRNGIAVKRSPTAIQQDASRGRPFGNEYEALVRQGAEKVRTEALGGVETEVYQVTDKEGRRRIWVTPDAKRLPLRLEVFRRRLSQTITTDFLNWQRGIAISDAFFAPEPGLAIETLAYQTFVDEQAERVPMGPVPILYSDLLHGH